MKYKLIKTYPGSPKLHTIISKREGTNMYFYAELQIESPEEYPEYWEKIEEIPEYVRLIRDSVWGVPEGAVCKVIKQNDYYISQWVLENIYIPNYQKNDENNDWFFLMKEHCIPATKEEYEAQEPKEVLFVTDDGVEIHKGDYYWYINKKSCIDTPINLKAGGKKEEYSGCRNRYYMFSTEQAAKDFIKSLRKPLFTTEDGVAIYEGDECWFVSISNNAFGHLTLKKIYYEWSKNGEYPYKQFKYFSTKEKAIEYVKSLRKIIYKAEDGIIYEGDKYYVASINIDGIEVRKYFVDEKNCLEYLDSNKPTYSKKQILDTIEEYKYNYKSTVSIPYLKEKLNLQ